MTNTELRALREDKGWTRIQTAKKLKATITQYRNWENGYSKIPLRVYGKIRNAFSIKICICEGLDEE